ncbi:hypothetical protein Y032_0064g3529 [Ancylostoma ceylanicum]|uniref:Small EDRK-rich factor-like N-terminal domain-containing protein n=1 Tax=Ancylostoma ceylanicum TaxID=53326 RepID=A0A016U0D6_9BILA|nr:hypothetical protein Y032_0064g3529 [Ancylostoma ceylanicum]
MEQPFWDVVITLNIAANASLQNDQRHCDLVDECVEVVTELTRRLGSDLLDLADVADVGTIWTVIKLEHIFNEDGSTRYTREEMARGHQKIQSQQKAQKRAEAAKKSQGCDQKGAAQKALHHKCTLVPVTAESRWEVDERCGDSMLKVRSSSRSRHDSTAATLRNRTRKDVYLFDKD